jgi:serine/threonine protein kinase
LEFPLAVAVNFDLQKRLGSGYFGEVWLAREAGLDTDRAIKLIPPDKVPNSQNFFHEAQLLKAAEHENVVAVYDTGTMADGRVYVAMEYLPKGSLEDEASGAYVPLTRARRIMVDALRGLEHAHSQGILHRDIKPANILVGPNSEGKLSDFGLALPIGVDPKSIGMKGYMYTVHLAPEVHAGDPYDELSEIYSCGITLYRLVNGDSFIPPPSGDLATLVKRGDFPNRSNYRDFVPRSVRLVVNRAMHVDPKRRFRSPAELRHAIERLELNMNWNEAALSQGKRWIAAWDNRIVEVERLQTIGKGWSVTLRKGPRKEKLRRITSQCHDSVSKAKAEQISRRILQDFVVGKLK